MQLTANVYVETRFPGANVGYITTESGVVMVESPHWPTDAVAWRREVEDKGTIRYLINTEPHEDHCSGNYFFPTPVVAHEKAREVMLAMDAHRFRETVGMMDPEGLPLIKDYRMNVPLITFSERLTLYVGRHSFQLIYMPGHSSGQIAVFVPEEKVVFTGDNVTYKKRGFLHEADPFAWLESLKRIGELEVDYIVPGHGEVCDRSYLAEEARYIQGCMDTVKEAVDKGWTKEEAVDRVSLPSPYPLDEGSENIATQLFKISVANLYDRLSE